MTNSTTDVIAAAVEETAKGLIRIENARRGKAGPRPAAKKTPAPKETAVPETYNLTESPEIVDTTTTAEETTVSTATPAAPTAKKPAPKKAPTPKPAAAKDNPKTPAAKKADAKPVEPKAAPAGAPKLGKPLVRILVALSKANAPMTRGEIGEKAQVDVPFLSTYIGSSDPEVRAANEAKRGTKGLITLGYVRIVPSEGAATTYQITAAGKKVVEKLKD